MGEITLVDGGCGLRGTGSTVHPPAERVLNRLGIGVAMLPREPVRGKE